MTLSASMSNALTGLNAASRMADVVASNVANSMTDGYGRRELDLSAKSIAGRGAGVDIVGTSRLVDRQLVGDRRLADAAVAAEDKTLEMLSRLEKATGTPDDPASLAGRITALEQSLVYASSDPASDIRLADVARRLHDVTGTLHANTKSIQAMRQEADASIETQVETLNRSLRQVESLNDQIATARSRNQEALGLVDQRQAVIDGIAGIVPLREIDRPGGKVALMSTSGVLLLDGPAEQFGFVAANHVVAEMTLSSGGLSGLTRDGVALNGVGGLRGGSLGATFALRDVSLVAAQDSLDATARDLVERFQDPQVDFSVSPGIAGLLTDSGAAFDAAATTGLSGRIAVNAAIDPFQGGALSRLRDGMNATAGPVGDPSQINRWLDALADSRALHSGGAQTNAAGHASRFSSGIGGMRLVAEEEAGFATARWAGLREAELTTGVDTDQEMQMLIRIEEAYAANARVLQTIHAMLQELLEI